MLLDDAIELGMNLITSRETHPDYQRTVDLAKKYSILSTGENIEDLLQQFVKRESPEDFKTRVELTRSVTGAVCGALEAPWNKVVRNERIKKFLELSVPSNVEKVDSMMDSFYGSSRKTKSAKGLEYWLKTRFFELTFSDPNAWIVVEWTKPDASEITRPHPFEVPSQNALNFSIINDETQWLFGYQDIKMKTGIKKDAKPAPGKRYTLYDLDFTVVFEQVDPKWFNAAKPVIALNEAYVKIGSLFYIQRTYEPKIGFAPVMRVGYKVDRATNSRTFVNPWHKALPYLESILKEGSEFQITMTLHVFPQKLQYGYRCPGPAPKVLCDKGRLKDDGSICPACRGIGFQFHQSANDAIIVALPDGELTSADLIDLDKLIVYKTPPTDLIKWQNEHVLQLKRECFEAVFTVVQNQQKSNAAGSAAGGNADAGTAVTATEIDTNMQGIYDSLEPFTEKESELYREIVTIMAILAGEALENITVGHVFPADFKMKTTDALLADLKNANESEAPSFLRDAITVDLAENVYVGDELGLLKFKTKRKYFPFNGKTREEIQFLLSSNFVAEREKVLYANFDSIFAEIEIEHPEFYLPETSADEQFEILEAKLQEWIEAIKPPAPVLPGFPFGQGEGDGGGDPGEDGEGGGAEDGDGNRDPDPGEEE